MSDKAFLQRNGISVLQPSSDGRLIIRDSNRLTESSPVAPVLDVVGSLANCAAVRLYWLDPAAYELRLVHASPASEDSRIPRASLQFPPAARQWLEALTTAEVLLPGDSRFACFPETAGMTLKSVMVVPLRTQQKLRGLLTLARTDAKVFGQSDIEAVTKLSGALIAAMQEGLREREVELLRGKLRSVRQENTLLERRLLERKVIERAKGLLQADQGWTEEEAYYHLRRSSRQQRIPMVVLAQRVIEVAVARDAAASHSTELSPDDCAA